ncbi:hypothetical protein SLE2022_374050 [Rubroshorea leprosula]
MAIRRRMLWRVRIRGLEVAMRHRFRVAGASLGVGPLIDDLWACFLSPMEEGWLVFRVEEALMMDGSLRGDVGVVCLICEGWLMVKEAKGRQFVVCYSDMISGEIMPILEI